MINRALIGALVLGMCLAGALGAGKQPPRLTSFVDDSIPRAEQHLLARSLDSSPAPLDGRVDWLSGGPVKWEDLRGKVIVLQSFDGSIAGKGALTRLVQNAGRFPADKVAHIAIHTPSGAAEAAEELDQRTFDFPVAIDAKGDFCDDMGIWKRPVTILIDKSGRVRGAGIASRHLQRTVTLLLDEYYDPNSAAPPPVASRDAAEESAAPKNDGPTGFPQCPPPRGAKDLCGQRGPDLRPGSWITAAPKAANKVVVLEFWATWCGPCRQSMPHLNELAARFKDTVVIVGITNEDPQTVRNFLKKANIDYSIGIDQGGALSSRTGHDGIPYAVVMCPKGIVRWQGGPMSLRPEVLQRIVDASGVKSNEPDAEEMRWAASR